MRGVGKERTTGRASVSTSLTSGNASYCGFRPYLGCTPRRDVGDVPGAGALELAELGGLPTDVAAGQVERQHPPAGRARVVHRHGAGLAGRVSGQLPDVAGRIGL